jgi:TPR repeat protein
MRNGHNQKLGRSIIIVFLVFTLAPSAFAENIIPPKGANSESVSQDMWSCINSAMRTTGGNGELLKGVDKELLQGHSTVGFLSEQSLAGPRPVALRDDGVIAPTQSVFNALRSSTRTDPYVVCLLLKGYRWENNKETGIEILQRLAGEGNVRAQAELGRAYYFGGLGVGRNNSIAFKLLSAAADANDIDGQLLLAILYSEGDGTLPDDALAAFWLKKAAQAGSQQAQRALPMAEQNVARHKKEIDEAASKLTEVRASAETGNTESQRILANYFIEGIGVSPEANSAIEWYKKAAQAGDAIAMKMMGVIYDKGRGVTVDYIEAVKWFKAAAEQGNAEAQYNIGVLTYDGYGTQRNVEEGKAWMRRAADQGNKMAIKALQSLK